MTVPYQQLLRNTAVRLNALVGTQVVTLAATYDTAVLTAANFKSADWPFNSFRDAILMAEEDFVWAIADTAGHPWRAFLSGTTPALDDGVFVPFNTSLGRLIVGAYGSVTDNTEGVECLEAELDEITRIRRLQDAGVLTLPSYLYRIDGRRIRHTRTSVVIEVCSYDRNVQLGAFAANDPMPLPDVLELPITARAVSILTKDNAFAEQAAYYGKFADNAIARIREGLTSVGSKAIPVSAGESA